MVHPLRKNTIQIQTNKANKKLKSEEINAENQKLNIHKINPNKFNLEDDVEANESFNKILKLFSSKPILKLFDPNKEIIVKTDVSSFAWGADIVQVVDEIEHPIAFASGTLNSSQRNWPTWKREAYGVLRAIKKWSHYLLGVEFTVVTDHAANVYLMDPTRTHKSIINNWVIELSIYKYKIIHRPGKTLFIEDGLSRSPNLLLSNLEYFKNETNLIMRLKQIEEDQKKDEICIEITKYLIENEDLKDETKKILPFDIKNHFAIEDNILYYIESNSKYPTRRVLRIVLPKNLIETIFQLSHCLPIKGHMGFNRTWNELAKKF